MLPVSPGRVNDIGRKCPIETGISDEMQAHVPQDYGTAIEVQTLMGVNKMIVSSQANRPIIGVIQDSLLGSYLMTFADVQVPRHQFMDCVLSAGEQYVQKMASLFKRAKKVCGDNIYTGRVLFSILFPEDFHYTCRNNASKEEPMVEIKNGILVSGVVDKKVIGRSHSSVIHRLYKEYSPETAAEFLSAVQFLVNRWLTYRGFSVGVADFIISRDNERGVETAIQKAYIEVQTIEESDDPEDLKEFRINNALNNRGQSLAINGLCKNNRLEVMINSGSKGTRMNIIQITGHLGQNNVEGRRIQAEIDNNQRTLPCFKRGDKHPSTRGFIERSFLKGLSPAETWFHAKAGREGVINTAVKTRDSGYAERKLVKRLEDLTIDVDHTVRNGPNNIISFTYGDSLDPTLMYNCNGPSFVDIDTLVDKLNKDVTEAIPEDEEDPLITINQQQRLAEVTQHIKEYRASIATLKTKSGAVYKKMLKAARTKLKEFLAERETLREM